MKSRLVLAAGAAFLLASCGSAEKSDASTEASADTAAAPEAAADGAVMADAAAPGAGSAPTREFMVGKWGEDGDCALAIDFKPDGSMDGPVDKWELENGELTMVGLPGTFVLKVIDDKTMESRADGGKGDPHKLTRC